MMRNMQMCQITCMYPVRWIQSQVKTASAPQIRIKLSASHPEGQTGKMLQFLNSNHVFFLTDLYMDPKQPEIHYKIQELLAGVAVQQC